MATAPISRKLNLTRDQLATFLSDQQQIRQFELLFSTVDQLQVIVGTDFEFQADTAAANANNALAQIIALAQDTAVDDAVLNAKVQQALDAIPRLAQALDLLSTAPRQEIGTIAPQNSDNVNITGGLISGLDAPLSVASGGIGVTTAPANRVFAGPTTGADAPPAFRALVAGDVPALTTGSDILYGNGSGGFSNVTIGTGVSFTSGTLSATGTGGDVVGPASSTDNAIARFDLTTGKLLQNSVVIVGDTGNITGVNALTAESLTVNDNSTFGTSNSDTINFVGRINSDFDPATDNTYDLGRVGHEWRDLYIDGTANIDSLIADTADINGGTIDNTTIGATTPQNGSFVNLSVTGTTSFDGSQGTSGQVLTSAGTGNTPTWTTPTTGTVTSVAALTLGTTGTDLSSTVVNGTTTPVITLQVPTASATNRGALSSADWSTFNNKQPAGTYVTAVSVVSANGLAGTSSGGATPALTLSTSVTGLLKGNGTAISAAVANVDYVGVSAPVVKTADFSVVNGDAWLINNKSGSTCTATLPAAASWSGRVLHFQNYQVQTLVSASSNVVPLAGGAAGTSILLASSGDSATLVSDGSNWLMTQYVPNNILLLE